MFTVSTFPLDEAPWIPVLWTPAAQAGGKHLPPLVGLRTVLARSHEISSLAITEPRPTPRSCARCTRSPPGCARWMRTTTDRERTGPSAV